MPKKKKTRPGQLPEGVAGELQRAIWLLEGTDDYQVTDQGENWAELIYIHNSPPHPVTRIEIRKG